MMLTTIAMILTQASPVGGTPLPKVLIIGDSISIGYTQPLRRLLQGKAEVYLIPENGGSTHIGLRNIDDWLGTEKWDVIHFNWGLHDLKYLKDGKMDVCGIRVSTLDAYTANLMKLVDRLLKTGAKLVWASTTPIPEGSPGRNKSEEIDFNRAAAEIMRKRGIAIDDLHKAVLPRLSEFQRPANVHFTDEGYEFLAGKVAESITKALESH